MPGDDSLWFCGFAPDGTAEYIGPDGWPRTPEQHAEILEDLSIDRAHELLDTSATPSSEPPRQSVLGWFSLRIPWRRREREG